MKKSKCAVLFATFFKIGLFTFGGGYAMIPMISREVAQKRNWITEKDILDVIAIAESTPGPIAINMATFVGFKIAHFWGAAAATVGIALPSLFIITIISYFISAFEHIKVIAYAFEGIRAGVLVLILRAFLSMLRQCPREAFSYAVMIAAFLLVAFFSIDVLPVLILCAALGVVRAVMNARRAVK